MQNQVQQFSETDFIQLNITLLIHRKEIISIILSSTIVKVCVFLNSLSHCYFI